MLREPVEADRDAFLAGGSRSDFRERDRSRESEAESGDELEVQEEAVADPQAVDEEPAIDSLEEDARLTSQWIPERPLNNMIFDIVDAAGTEGVSTKVVATSVKLPAILIVWQDLMHSTFGGGIVKPIERLLPRFVDSWQISQPLHLRHLAIIRDTKLSQRTGYYVHYTYNNFEKLVDSGRTSWEAVAAVENGRKKNNASIPPPGAQAQVDNYGFPILSQNEFQGAGNDAALSSCLRDMAAQPRKPREITISGVRSSTDTLRAHPSNNSKAFSKSRKLVEKVSLPPNFKLMNYQERSKLKGSQLAAIKYACGKAEKEISLRIEDGESEAEARESVYAQVDAYHVSIGLKPPSEAMKAYLAGDYDSWRGLMEEEVRGLPQDDGAKVTKPSSPQDAVPSTYAREQPPLPSTSKTKKRTAPGRDNQSTAAQYLPSIVAHTQPLIVYPPVHQRTSLAPAKPIRRRPPGSKARQSLIYLPSVIAHTQPYLDPAHFNKRRQRKSQLPRHLTDSLIIADNSTALPAITVIAKRKRETSGPFLLNKKRNLQDSRLSFYERLSSSLLRSSTMGVLASAAERDSRRRGQPWGILVVFRSHRLKGFTWFTSGDFKKLKPLESTPEQKRAQVLAMYERAQPRGKVPKSPRRSDAPEVASEDPGSVVGELPGALPNLDQTSVKSTTNVFREAILGVSESPIARSCDAVPGQWLPLYPEIIGETENVNQDNADTLTTTPVATKQHDNEDIQINGNALGDQHALAADHTRNGERPVDVGISVGPSTTGSTQDPEFPTLDLVAASMSVVDAVQARRETEMHPGVSHISVPAFLAQENSTAGEQHMSPLLREGDQHSENKENPNCIHVYPGSTSSEDPQRRSQNLTRTSPGDSPGTSASERLPELTLQEPVTNDPNPKFKTPKKLTPHGGSMALLRKNIIKDLLELCGGVLPNDRALEVPFAREWRKHGHAGQPDSATIKATIGALTRDGYVYKLTFSFQTPKGNTIIKAMVVKSTLSIDDPKIQEVQAKMIAFDPYSYVPKELRCVDDRRQAFVESIQAQKDRIQRVGEEDAAGNSKMPWKPLYQIRYEARKKIAEERARKMLERDSETQKINDERRRQRRDKAEAQRIKKQMAELRSKFPKERRMTAAEQNEIIEEYNAAFEAWSSLSSTGNLPALPAPPAVVEGRTFHEFRSLSLPDPAKLRTDSIVPQPCRRRPLPAPGVTRSIRKVERLATLKNPLPKPKFRNLVLPSEVGELDVFKLPTKPRRPILREGIQAKQNIEGLEGEVSEDPSLSDDEQFRAANLSKQPPWEVLQLSTINPDRLTNFQGLSGLLTSHEDDISNEFHIDLDEILRWELHYVEHAYSYEGMPFVNHTMLHKHKQADNSLIDMNDAIIESWTGKNGRHVSRRIFPAVEEQPGRLSRLADAADDDAYDTSSSESSSLSPDPEPEVEISVHPFEEVGLLMAPVDGGPSEARFGACGVFRHGSNPFRKRKKSRVERTPKTIPKHTAKSGRKSQPAKRYSKRGIYSREEDAQDSQRPHKKIRLRGPRRNLSQRDERRLLVAVIIVRTVAGGLDRNIDWKLVAKVFEPEFDEMSINQFWAKVRAKYKVQYEKILADFEEAFPTAYEQGDVPAVDFEHLEDYPWAWLVDWTLDMTDLPTESAFELPAQRSGIDGLFSLKAASDVTVAEFFSPDHPNSVPKRQAILSKQAYAMPLTKSPELLFEEEDSTDFSIVKTWIRANNATPAATYKPETAQRKLSIFRSDIIDRALKDLLASKVLSGQKENRVIPGRNYDLSELCISCLAKSPSISTLRAAVKFKTWLDEQFQANDHQPVDIATIMTDAQALVLANLFASHRIRLRPKDPPANKYGLLNGGYETRQMDKSRLKFAISISPTKDYIPSIPLLPLLSSHPPPAPHLNNTSLERIPLWYDINDALIPVLWDMALAAVLSTVSVRPGVQLGEIERAVRPAMGGWEVALVLEWGASVGVMESVGSGWIVREWWWGIFGGEEVVNEHGEKRGIGVGEENGEESEGNENEREVDAVDDDGSGGNEDMDIDEVTALPTNVDKNDDVEMTEA